MPTSFRFVVLVAAFLLESAGNAQMFHSPEPVPPALFPIMAWGSAPSEPEQLTLMKEAGLNVAGFCSIDDARKVRNAGLACFVSDPRVNGYDWSHLPPDAEVRAKVAQAVKDAAGNPAVIGYYLRDEPHASLMPAMGRVAALLKEFAPGTLPYVNLFPYMVSKDRMGAPNYETYMKMLVDTIGQPFLSYDNYSLVNGEMLDFFYNNLDLVRKVSLETRTPFWNCILANAHFNYMEPSDATFHLQVYATLAYGGKGIQYFTYYTPNIGNYRLGAVDPFGRRTATWDALRRINFELRALAPVVVKLRSTGVYHFPDVPEFGKPLSASRLIRDVRMIQRRIRPPIQGRVLVGEFEDEQGRPYAMIVNKDLHNSFQFTVELRQAGRKLIRINNYSGREEALAGEMDWLAPGAGILLRLE